MQSQMYPFEMYMYKVITTMYQPVYIWSVNVFTIINDHCLCMDIFTSYVLVHRICGLHTEVVNQAYSISSLTTIFTS